MTPEELAAMDAKATAGPWKTAPDHICDQDYETCVEVPDKAGQFGTPIAIFEHDWAATRISWKAAQSNAALCVALRNAVPEIIAALRAQQPIGDVAGLVEGKYLIRKGGYFYRPNSQGYTINASEAGRYTLAEAEQLTHPNGKDGPRDGLSFLHEDEIPAAALTAQARRIAELEGENARLREALQDAADFAEIRIKDGIEIGAVVWRMALENIRADVCAELKGGRDADR